MIELTKFLKYNNNTSNDSNSNKKSISQEYVNFLEKIRDGVKTQMIGEDPEEKKANELARIQAKLQSGARLSAKEMSFLQKYYPDLYIKALRIQRFREALKQRLKSCRTKEEAQNVITSTYASVGKDDPDREALLAAIGNVVKQYTSSHAYQSLPENSEELKKAKSKKNDYKKDMFKEDEESENEDNNLSYSIDSNGYQEATVGDDEGICLSA